MLPYADRALWCLFVVGGPLSSEMLGHGAQPADEPAWCWELASCQGVLALKHYGIAGQTNYDITVVCDQDVL